MFIIQASDLILGDEGVELSKTEAQRIFFDIEGDLDRKGEVLQLAFLRTDWDFNILEVRSDYFRNFDPITPEAFKVHHLSSKFLWEVSDSYFETEICKYPFFETKPTMYITYGEFDTRRINEVCRSAGLPEVEFGSSVSTLMAVPSSVNWFNGLCRTERSLQRALKSNSNAEKRVEETINALPPDIDKTRLKAHDALWDTIAMYELCKGMVG